MKSTYKDLFENKTRNEVASNVIDYKQAKDNYLEVGNECN